MSYKQCLANGLNEGVITKEQYDEQLEFLGMQERYYKGQGLNPTEASIKAAKDAYEVARVTSKEKKRNNRLTMAVQIRLKKYLQQYRNVKGEEDYANAAKAVYARDDNAPFASIETLVQEELSIVQKYMDEFLAQLKESPLEKIGGIFGYKNKKKQTTSQNFIKALFDENTSDEIAKKLAESFIKANKLAIQRHNRYGGKIKVRDDWRAPQPHDFLKVRKAGEDVWVNKTLELVDMSKMIDQTTGFAFTAETLRIALSDVYKTISTQGFNKLKPGEFGRTSLANKRIDHRFLIFKNADSWLEYQKLFGKDDNILNLINDHLQSLTRDTALMKALGPDPDRGHLWLKQTIKKKAAEDAVKEAQGQFGRKTLRKLRTEEERAETIYGGGFFESGIDNLYLLHKNQLNKPSDQAWAKGFASLRNLITSAYLGSASIVALTDFNWQRMTNQFNGLPAFKSSRRTLDLFYEGLVKGDKTLSKVAIRSGLIAESWTTMAHQQTRFFLESNGAELAQRLSDSVITLSGLSGQTQAGRWGFGMELMGFFADNAGKTFKELDSNFQRGLKRYGITEGEWEIARQTKLYDAGIDDPKMIGKGVVFLRPDDIRTRTDIPEFQAEDLATKFYDFLKTETEYAVPSVSAKGRAWMLGAAKPGTFTGELILSAAMFKQFPITLMFTHVARGLKQSGFPGKFRYLGDLAITGAMYGAFTMEVREITKGRNPTPLSYIQENPGEYFLRALITGGGLGLFGDYFITDHNRYGKTLAETLAGPQMQFISDLIGIPKNALYKAIRGEDTNITGDTLKFIKRNTPGASLWYLRLIWERVIMDTVARMVDDDFDSKNSRMINNYLKNTQQEYWWEPGEILPTKSPSIF